MARSRLHRGRFLQVNTQMYLKAVSEIYKIFTLLHRSNIRDSTIFMKIRQIFFENHMGDFVSLCRIRRFAQKFDEISQYFMTS